MARIVAGDAAFHRDGNFERDVVMRGYVGVALLAVHSCLTVSGVTKENKIFDRINLPLRERCGVGRKRHQFLDLGAVGLHRTVAVHASRNGGKTSFFARVNVRMAVLAIDLQRGMPFVAELNRFVCGAKQDYGNEKATKESE